MGKTTTNTKFLPASTTQYIVDGNDGIINVDTSTNAVTIILPNILNSGFDNTDKTFFVNDFSGNASVNNITIIAVNNTCNGLSEVKITSNLGSALCTISELTDWFIVVEPSSGGSGTIKGSLPATAGLVTFTTGVADTITTDGYFKYDVTESLLEVPKIKLPFGANSGYLFQSDALGNGEWKEPDLIVWKTTGNVDTDPAIHFIGTIDNNDLVFRTDNVERLRITTNGNLSIGTISSNARLDIKGDQANGSTNALYVRNLNDVILQRIKNNGHLYINNTDSTSSQFQMATSYVVGLSILNYSQGNQQMYFDAAFENNQVIAKHTTAMAICNLSSQLKFMTASGLTVGSPFSFTTQMNIDATTGNVGIGIGGSSGIAKLTVKGSDASSSNSAFYVANIANTKLMQIRNDGLINFLSDDIQLSTTAGYCSINGGNYKALRFSITGLGTYVTLSHNTGDITNHKPTTIAGDGTGFIASGDVSLYVKRWYNSTSSIGVENICFTTFSSGNAAYAIGQQGTSPLSLGGISPMMRFTYDPVSFGASVNARNNNYHRVGFGTDVVSTHRVVIADGLRVSTGNTTVAVGSYNNNADAVSAGLPVGTLYIRIGHGLDIVV